MAVVAGDERIEAFIERWSRASAGERSNYQLFLIELCELIGVERPGRAVADESRNAYVFERRATRQRRDGTSTFN